MIYPKIPLAQSILEIYIAKGIQHIVISPGSRNAPLTIGFTNNPFFTCYSIADERCAAFFALGIAQQIQKPVAVLCTSGSALLNYYPAFAEAFYSQIPLIVLSADRPQSNIDIGDGQTIRQENVFTNHSLFNANLSEEASEENDLKIQEAIHISITLKGPVHINIPFEEPLYETTNEIIVQPKWKNFEMASNFETPIHDLVSKWNTATKKMILIGGCDPDFIHQSILNTLGNDSSVIVMTEVTSNAHHRNFINHIDTFITPFTDEDYKNFQPEILITIGGMIVSKRIKSFLRKYQPSEHWHVDELRAYDTFGCLSQHIKSCPNDFFEELFAEKYFVPSDYLQKALQIKEIRATKSKMYLENIIFSDFKAFEIILSQIPHSSQLQISNSAAIRYAQLFDIHDSIAVFCNRGTSGIDGSTSTAIGACVASGKDTILITGDVSFLYDSNALWNHYIPNNFKIILINNGGGGIFRILPGHQENATFNTYFETSHCLTAEQLAKMHQIEYLHASDKNTLETRLQNMFESQKPFILEVFTPTKHNNEVLLKYFDHLT